MNIAERLAQAKTDISLATGMPDDLLHVHLGLFIFVGTALLLRQRMRSPIPILAVLIFELLNEVSDYLAGGDWYLAGSLLDIVNTMLWPTVLFLLARRGAPPPSNRVEPTVEE